MFVRISVKFHEKKNEKAIFFPWNEKNYLYMWKIYNYVILPNFSIGNKRLAKQRVSKEREEDVSFKISQLSPDVK